MLGLANEWRPRIARASASVGRSAVTGMPRSAGVNIEYDAEGITAGGYGVSSRHEESTAAGGGAGSSLLPKMSSASDNTRLPLKWCGEGVFRARRRRQSQSPMRRGQEADA